MNILALEFSSSQRSVAVLPSGGAAVCEVIDPSSTREMQPFALIESALTQAKLEREAIECVAIGLGPGSYTGIRVALSLAQGWQLATGVKLLGISTAECVAQQAVATGLTSKFTVVIDAQRGEFYLADYEHGGGGLQETQALRLASRAEVLARVAAGERLVGPEVQRWFPSGQMVAPQASTLARLAAGRNDFVPGEKLEPIYLREIQFVKAPPPRVLPS